MTNSTSGRLRIFLVLTPLQLLNALEAWTVYGEDQDRSLFLLERTGNVESERQIDAVLERFPGHETLWMTREMTASEIVVLVRAYAGPVSDAQVFMGSSRLPSHRAVARQLSSERPVLIDEGNTTLLLARRRQKPYWRLTNGHRQRLTKLGRRARLPVPEIVRDVIHPSAREFSSVEFFSIYRAQAGSRDTWRRNEMTLLRGLRRPDSERREPILIGSTLVETGLIAEDKYSVLIERAVAQMRSAPIYLAHRDERHDKLARLADRYGVVIVRPRACLELMCVEDGIIPSPLHAVISTACDTLRVIFPEIEIVQHLPSLEDVDPHGRRQVTMMIEAQRRSQAARYAETESTSQDRAA